MDITNKMMINFICDGHVKVHISNESIHDKIIKRCIY